MSKLEITPEILRKASECETAEEIQNKAKEFGKEITLEQAQRLFDMSHASGAVSDEELDNVSGGVRGGGGGRYASCRYCGKLMDFVKFEKHTAECHPEMLSDFLSKPHYEPLC